MSDTEETVAQSAGSTECEVVVETTKTNPYCEGNPPLVEIPDDAVGVTIDATNGGMGRTEFIIRYLLPTAETRGDDGE